MKRGFGLLSAMVVCIIAANVAVAQETSKKGAAVKVWASDIISHDTSPPDSKAARPVTIVGARNGTFSGKVLVESGSAIKGLVAAVGPISGPGGDIPPANVQVRYGAPWDTKGWPGPDESPDILMESAPDVAPEKGRAILPVWVTVRVPRDAKAGTYRGEVTVRPQGAPAVKVPLELDVQDWMLPDTQDYRTWMDFVQSPDTLAMEYKVPLWSAKHWELIGRSFRLLSGTGARTVYVPLICRTNLGNEQSMVRWIRKGQDKYEYDFSIMEKYLDSAEKNLGKPELVVLQVWDICLSHDSLKRGLWGDNMGGKDTREARTELLNKGPRVTLVGSGSKESDMAFLPRYEDPASEALWRPLMDELRKRMDKRGLGKSMMLGLMPDLWPNKEEVTFWKGISGDMSWVIHGHAGVTSDAAPGNKRLHKVADIGYAAFIYNMVFNVNPDKGRMYGWQGPALISNYPRGGGLWAAPVHVREFPGLNITGGQRGVGRISADLWPAIRDKRGKRVGAAYGRYPENNWRNLDISGSILAPGPDGPLSTARMENLREGVQACEARIFLESALLDPARKAKLGEDLAARCQTALDEHHRAMWKTVWSNDEELARVGTVGTGRDPAEGLWQALEKVGKKLPDYWSGPAWALRGEEARKGRQWYARGWQEREKKLFALAGEATAKLRGQ
ncbi:MAG: hypothetical protein JXL80_00215 [Planctomycetes bacterium]|nr:hypothetical protein [Planctomycetota bacterium]